MHEKICTASQRAPHPGTVVVPWRYRTSGGHSAALASKPSQAEPCDVAPSQAKPSQTHISCLTVWNLGRLNRVWQDRCTQVYSGFTPLTGGPTVLRQTYCRETHVHNSHPHIEGCCLFYHIHYGASMLNLISQRGPSNPNQVHNGDQRLHPLH